MNNVENQFNKLLETADKVAELYNKEDNQLTDEEVDTLMKILGEDNDPMQKLPSNNGQIYNENTDPSQNETQTVLVSVNPVTGVLNTIPYKEENITEESINTLLDLEDEDLKNVEIGWEPFVDSANAMYPGLNDDELKQLLEVLNKYRSGIKFPYYKELPEKIKKEIHSFAKASASENNGTGDEIKQLQNMLAKELFDTIITQNYSTKAYADLTKFTIDEINKQKDELSESAADYNSRLRNEYEVEFLKKADDLEQQGDTEKADKLRKISKMFIQSYTYEDMYNAYVNRKIKVKNIQIDKFKRTCQEFNRKYYNNKFTIKDVGLTIGVLDRNLDKKYNIACIQKFIVLFINYTKNFTPANIDEHVFMFYFIQNILALDIKIPGSDYYEFNEVVKQNIYKFLDLIIERDKEKEELKKGNKNGKVHS